ncbi:MAG TPA: L-histidine N(alpha)-methyltransferase [Pyrinomonadaceae bacterium]|nr:L-histidine N(alpha)-methyltransferase [Pyrinomonadaceae bacterium]
MAQTEPVHIGEDRLVIHNLVKLDPSAGFAEDVRRGLSSQPKRLSPKYFYDELGSLLFDAICLLPEYYLTRAENEIIERYAEEIATSVDGHVTLLEMGSGSASKTKRIVEALLNNQRDLLFIPVDISASALESSSRILLQSFPRLRIEAYASEYFDALSQLSTNHTGRTLALFLGSNISNFGQAEAPRFLRALRGVLRAGDALLLGADLKKDAAILEPAYDDALGLTAAFNLNLLGRVNRELNGNFDLRSFKHDAFYNEQAGRVEIHIESTRSQTVTIRDLDMSVSFAEGERIHTENSYKYDFSDIARLASGAGFQCTRTWLDSQKRFSSNLLMAVD